MKTIFQNNKKYTILIALMVSCLTFTFGQDYQFSDIIGTYEGALVPSQKGVFQLKIKADKSFIFSMKKDGIWIGIATGRLEKDDFYTRTSGSTTYQFKIIDSPEGYTDLAISILDEASKASLKFKGVYVLLDNEKEGVLSFDMSRAGGNPIIKPKKKVEKIALNGSTASWGGYEAEFSPSIEQGAFIFDYFYSLFRYFKKDNYYTISNKLKDTKEIFNIKYRYDKETGQLLLVETPTLNKHLFSTTEIENQKKKGPLVTDEKSILRALVEQTYLLFDEKYKPLNQKFTKYGDDLTGRFIAIYDDGSVYIGDLKQGRRSGKGILFLEKEKQIGTWLDGDKKGYFKVESGDIAIDAYFEKNKNEGTWTYTYNNGKVVEVIFENNKKISVKEIKAKTPAALIEIMTMVEDQKEALKVFGTTFSTFVYENKYDKLSLAEAKEELQKMSVQLTGFQDSYQKLSLEIEELYLEAQKNNCLSAITQYKKAKSSNQKFLDAVNSSMNKTKRAEAASSKKSIRSIVFQECYINISSYGMNISDALEKVKKSNCYKN